MIDKKLLDGINSSHGGKLLESLYGSDLVQKERRRYNSLVEGMSPQNGFPSEFSGAADNLRIFSAPGRTELGGNHTDHNRGRVLAASIQMDALAVVAPLKTARVFFRSDGFPDVRVNLEDADGNPDLMPKPEEKGTTEALVRGIASEFAARGVKIGGFCANASSTVLHGSGLSSSAAVEVLFAKIFDNLYGSGNMTAVELAQIGQKAENVFFGKPCGLMDQAASASGGAVAIDFANPDSPLLEKIEFDPMAAGYSLCVVNTHGSHADLTPDYAAIPQEMGAVSRCLGSSFLRETDLAQILSGASEIRKITGDRALLRAIHFHNENHRVEQMTSLLETLHSAKIDSEKRELMAEFLDLVNKSGDSSWELLQNIYSPRNPGEQGVALALAVSKNYFNSLGIKAACRIHGGGFAGTIQAYVPAERLDAYRERMESLFGSDALTVLYIRKAGAVELEFGE